MMKKILWVILTILLIAVFLLPAIQVKAVSPYNTWTLGPGGRPFMSQDAYSAYAEMDIPVDSAQDMFVSQDGFIYIADTGNGLIQKLKNFEVVATYGDEILEGPTGVFVDGEGIIYVADGRKNTIVIMDPDGNLINEFGRPDEPLFGKNREFLPKKIAVDVRKNLYIISEGSVNGIVQMNTDGNFIGYFGANTATMSLKMILQRLFLTEEQLSQFIINEAASPSSISIDNQSMVYTITAGGLEGQSIRKFTIAGNNIFPDTFGSSTFRDIDVSDNGLVLAVDSQGLIFEYELNGSLLFLFGAQDKGEQRMGTLRNPAAIERHGEFIYVLDQDKNSIVVFQRTAFASLVHEGIRLYMEGFYNDAKPYFEEVLDYNGAFIMSYQAIADAYYKERDYANALTAYRYAEDRGGYSQAYWELRNAVLQLYLGQALLWIIGLSLGQVAVKRLDQRYRWFDPIRNWFQGLRRFKLVDDFLYTFRFIKQPADSFYYIKTNEKGSLTFAALFYLWVIVARVLSLYLTGFTFNPYTSPAEIPIANEVVFTALFIVMWNAANYLVSTISDGEGRIRDVIIGSAYSLFPYAFFAIPLALFSRVLTANETFLYSFSQNLMLFWTGLILFIMVKEIHNYSFSETVKNVLLTIFTMALFVLTGYILFVLFNQLFDFVSAVLQEVRLRG